MARLNGDEALSRWCKLKPEEYADADFGTRSRSIYCEGAVLYNYGSHFPLAKFLGVEGKGKNEKKLFLINGDRWRGSGGWGNPTSSYQADLSRLISGPTVSANALRSAGVTFERVAREMIVAWERASLTHSLIYDPKTRAYFLYRRDYTAPGPVPAAQLVREPWTPPRQGMFVPGTGSWQVAPAGLLHAGEVPGEWHVLGAVLLRVPARPHDDPARRRDEENFLCGLDEGNYFVSKLRRRAGSIGAAFSQLKPAAVRAAEKAGVAVPRQGEWFFLPGPTTAELAATLGLPPARLLKLASRNAAIPDDRARGDRASNDHCATLLRVGSTDKKAQTLVSGKVVHRDRWRGRRTGEHKTIDLGDRWHVARRNTELASWSMSGSFD